MSEATARPIEFVPIAVDTLSGDLRDFLLDRQKHDHNPLPWPMRAEREQRAAVESATQAARTWVSRAVGLIAAAGHQPARGRLVKLQAKEGLQVQVNVAASDPMRHVLLDHLGAPVLLIIADAEQFAGARSDVPVHKDQPNMLDDETE